MKQNRSVVALNFPPKNGGQPLNEVINEHNIYTNMCGCPTEEDVVYMSANSFGLLFGKSRSRICRTKQRLAVVKIKSKITKRVVYRRYVFNPEFSGLDSTNLALNPASIRELGENSTIVGGEVIVCPGCAFSYYWCHPFHATRVSMKLGVFSVALAILSIVATLLVSYHCYC